MKKIILFMLVLAWGVGLVRAQPAEDWTLHQGEQTHLQTPSNWINLNDPALVAASRSQLILVNPILKTILDSLLPQIEAGAFDLLLLDPSSASYVHVTVDQAGATASPADLQENLQSLYENLGAEQLVSALITLPIGEALQLSMQLPISDDRGRPLPRQQELYVVIEQGEIYVITLATDPRRYEELAPIFEQVMQSFGIGTASESTATGPLAQAATPTTPQGGGLDPVEMLPSAGGDVTRFSTDDVSIVAPSNWLNIADEQTLLDYLDTATAIDPALVHAAEAARQQLASGAFEIVLLDPDAQANFNVVIQDLGIRVGFADLERELVAQFTSMNAEILGTEVLQVPAGEVLRIDMSGIAGQRQIQYVLMVDTTAYFMTFTASVDTFEDYEPIFQDMINTFRLLD